MKDAEKDMAKFMIVIILASLIALFFLWRDISTEKPKEHNPYCLYQKERCEL